MILVKYNITSQINIAYVSLLSFFFFTIVHLQGNVNGIFMHLNQLYMHLGLI